MRWFFDHPKISLLIQTAREQNVLPRIPKIVIIELKLEEITEINNAVKENLEKRGGRSNISKLKSIGASSSHKGKFIGIHPDKAGTLIPSLPKQFKKGGYAHGFFEAIEQIYQDKKLNKRLNRCNYAIALNSYLLELYGKKYPVFLAKEGISPDKYTTGWCWVLIHEFVHIIEIENKKPIFENFSDTKREAERILGNYLPFEFWNRMEPMEK